MSNSNALIVQTSNGKHRDVGEGEQFDLFVVSLVTDVGSYKDDMSSMELPIYSLSTKKDLKIRSWERGDRRVTVIPSVLGAATVFDKDLLIYSISQLMRMKDLNVEVSRTIKIQSSKFLESTARSDGGASYASIVDMCRRLKGTVIETNVKTLETEETNGFSLIEDYKVLRRSKNGKGALELQIRISDWLFRAVQNSDVLTLHPSYFELRKPLERRVYELARKHCGHQPYFKCAIGIIHEKIGSERDLKYLTRELKKMSAENNLPEYRIFIERTKAGIQFIVMNKDTKKLLPALQKESLIDWYSRLTKVKPKKND